MKKMNFFKFAAAILCCVFATAVASCDKNDDDTQTSAFKFNPAQADVVVGATANVTISGGTEPYTVTSSDVKIATVNVSKSVITVTGVKAGSAVVMVSDKNKQSGKLTVTVKDVLTFDKNSASIAVGKEDVVTVKNGVAPYTATVKDTKVATASVKDGKITVKGVKAGTTTITVTDKNKLSGTINITVK